MKTKDGKRFSFYEAAARPIHLLDSMKAVGLTARTMMKKPPFAIGRSVPELMCRRSYQRFSFVFSYPVFPCAAIVLSGQINLN
jgi:hypothetical protein